MPKGSMIGGHCRSFWRFASSSGAASVLQRSKRWSTPRSVNCTSVTVRSRKSIDSAKCRAEKICSLLRRQKGSVTWIAQEGVSGKWPILFLFSIASLVSCQNKEFTGSPAAPADFPKLASNYSKTLKAPKIVLASCWPVATYYCIWNQNI